MRVLHIENTASVPYYISKGLKILGVDSVVLETAVVPENYGADKVIPIKGTSLDKVLAALKVANYAKDFDVIHFHQGIRENRFDKRLIYAAKPSVIHYHGSETRMNTGMMYADKAKYKVVSTPDLLKWHPTATFIPNPCDAEEFKESFPESEKPVIMHLPTNRKLKGTSIVLEAIDQLKNFNEPFEFELVENVPREEALQRMQRANIIVDQMNIRETIDIPGLFGMTSLEAMSMGKVAVSSLNDDMRKFYPSNPIVSCNANPVSLALCLAELLEDFDKMKAIGKKGRPYIEQYHSPLEIAKKHIEIYKEALK